MSLTVYPYNRNDKTGLIEDVDEQPKEPFNDLFGIEIWRLTVWGSSSLNKLNCHLLNSLKHQDRYAEFEDIQQLKNEIVLVKENILKIIEELKLDRASFEFRLDNALEAIRIAEKYPNGGVCIG